MTADDVRAVLGPRWEVTETPIEVVLGGVFLQATHIERPITITAFGPPYTTFYAHFGDCTGEGTTPRAAVAALVTEIDRVIEQLRNVRPLVTLLACAIATREHDAKAKGN